MIFDVLRFIEDFNIQTSTSGKNTQPGWINIKCPMCDDDSNHGGFNIKKGHYNCWKCGWSPLPEVVAALLSVPKHSARLIIDEYKSSPRFQLVEKEKVIKNTKIELPYGSGPLKKKHKEYLKRRNFDPEQLEILYNLKGTTHLGDYPFRIIAPIYYEGKLVSYQGRDITGKDILRYKACKLSEEIINHKKIFYNLDSVKDKTIIVEGITDVWRFGPGAISPFGTTFTNSQVNCLVKKKIKRAFILFDPDEKAQIKAEQLAYSLSSFKIETVILSLDIKKDPAAMSQKDADFLIKNLKL